MSRFIRGRSPGPFIHPQQYRPQLRIDFQKRCAYCERPEAHLGGDESFEVDHFRPFAQFPELRSHYPNLYYACAKCNRIKGAAWPSGHLSSQGFRFSDPCEEDMYTAHLHERTDGKLEELTPCGQYTRDHIRLDRPAVLKWRQQRRHIEADIQVLERAKQQIETLAATAPQDFRAYLEKLEARIADARLRYLP